MRKFYWLLIVTSGALFLSPSGHAQKTRTVPGCCKVIEGHSKDNSDAFSWNDDGKASKTLVQLNDHRYGLSEISVSTGRASDGENVFTLEFRPSKRSLLSAKKQEVFKNVFGKYSFPITLISKLPKSPEDRNEVERKMIQLISEALEKLEVPSVLRKQLLNELGFGAFKFTELPLDLQRTVYQQVNQSERVACGSVSKQQRGLYHANFRQKDFFLHLYAGDEYVRKLFISNFADVFKDFLKKNLNLDSASKITKYNKDWIQRSFDERLNSRLEQLLKKQGMFRPNFHELLQLEFAQIWQEIEAAVNLREKNLTEKEAIKDWLNHSLKANFSALFENLFFGGKNEAYKEYVESFPCSWYWNIRREKFEKLKVPEKFQLPLLDEYFNFYGDRSRVAFDSALAAVIKNDGSSELIEKYVKLINSKENEIPTKYLAARPSENKYFMDYSIKAAIHKRRLDVLPGLLNLSKKYHSKIQQYHGYLFNYLPARENEGLDKNDFEILRAMLKSYSELEGFEESPIKGTMLHSILWHQLNQKNYVISFPLLQSLEGLGYDLRYRPELITPRAESDLNMKKAVSFLLKMVNKSSPEMIRYFYGKPNAENPAERGLGYPLDLPETLKEIESSGKPELLKTYRQLGGK